MFEKSGRLTTAALLAGLISTPSAGQLAPDRPVFRAAVEMVSMAAVVRDQRGRVVASLEREDFEVLDGGERRTIIDLRSERSAPASVAFLIDGSGSMRVGATLDAARLVADQILSNLDPTRDEVALYTFDSRLIPLYSFTRDFDGIRARLEDLESFGTTSLYDAIADAARLIAPRARHRRAIVVLTDGADNSSTLDPAEVSGIASSIDVPVYVFSLNDGGSPVGSASLADLARWTGGALFSAGDRVLYTTAAQQLLEELRHQYVLAFEPSSSGGWRRVEIRTRRPGFTVRARSWYLGSSSH